MTTRTLTAPLARDSHTDVAASSHVVDVGHLFVVHAPFLARVVERLTGSPSIAEDVVQEAFIVAHRRRRELRDVPELRGWLYRVCANLVRQQKRSLWRRFRLLGAIAVEPPRAPEIADATVERREEAMRIRCAILEMPFEKRECFVLYELEGQSTKQVAALLGIPEGTVSSRLSSARDAFRAVWSANDEVKR